MPTPRNTSDPQSFVRLVNEILHAGERNNLTVAELREAFRRGLSEKLEHKARKDIPTSQLNEFGRMMRRLDSEYATKRAALRQHALRLNKLGRIKADLDKFPVVSESVITYDFLARNYTIHINCLLQDRLIELLPVMQYLEEGCGLHIRGKAKDLGTARAYEILTEPEGRALEVDTWELRIAELWVRASDNASCGPRVVDVKKQSYDHTVYEWQC